jgi:Viral BACON domain
MTAKRLRLALWTALALALAAPAQALDLVGQTSARFVWTAATGPVANYVVYVARNGAAFPTLPTQTVSTTEATVTGAYGDSIQVQVAARDAVGTVGPMSQVSDVVRFVAPAVPPALTLSTTALTASATQGATATQSFTIRNTGGGTLTWSVSEALGWLSVSPASGSATTETDTVTVSFNTSGLAVGSQSGSITVGATGLPSQTIAVTLNVTGGSTPSLVLSTTAITASTAQGSSPAAQSFTVRNGGGGTLTWSATEGVSWLALAPTSGTATTDIDTVTLTFNAASLAAGTYRATIGVAATRLPSQQIAVTLTVSATPKLQLSASALSLTTTQGENPAPVALTVRNTGSGTLTWSVSDNAAWLSASPASGTTTSETDSVSLAVDVTGLAAGTYTANLVVAAPGATSAPQTVVVTLVVEEALGVPGQPHVGTP